MTSWDVVGLLATLIVMLVGLVGAVLPVLPGPSLVFLAALAHRVFFGPRSVGWWVIGVLAMVTVVTLGLDLLASTLGARQFGSTWRGMVGAAVGALMGIFWIPPFGLLIGPLLGAFLAELWGGKEFRAACKAGVGATVGVVAGTVGKLAASVAMICFWLFALLWQGH